MLAVALVAAVGGVVAWQAASNDNAADSSADNAAQQPVDTTVARWEPVADAAGGFNMELPAPVRAGSAELKIAENASAVVTFHEGPTMSLAWFAYPPGVAKAAAAVDELRTRTEIILANLFKVPVSVSGQPAQVAGQEGAFFRVTAGRSLVRAYAVAAGDRFYLLTARTGPEWRQADEDRMVRSFRLVPSP